MYLIYDFWFVSTGLRLTGVLLKSFWSFSRLPPLYVTWGLRRDTHHTAELLSCLWGKTAICLISPIYTWGRVKRFHFSSLIYLTFLLIMMQKRCFFHQICATFKLEASSILFQILCFHVGLICSWKVLNSFKRGLNLSTTFKSFPYMFNACECLISKTFSSVFFQGNIFFIKYQELFILRY